MTPDLKSLRKTCQKTFRDNNFEKFKHYKMKMKAEGEEVDKKGQEEQYLWNSQFFVQKGDNYMGILLKRFRGNEES